ncbi:MAG: amidohydrolase family protein [Acidimicrobiaceae bacterium]|nr:amidohydrolase family protein [Acidimicrobiaceae bacterium]
MWLTNCTVVDVESGAVRPQASIEVIGDRITQVVTRSDRATEGESATTGSSQHYDLGGRYVLPGLISCHTHLSVVYPFSATDETESAGLTTLRSLARARDALEAGITTIRCVHEQNRADLLLRRSADEGWAGVPRIFGAGQALSTTGGHGWGMGASYADGADEFLSAARAELAAGADHLKVFITGGLAHAGEVMEGMQLTVEELASVVRAAREKAKYVVAHAANSVSIAQALDVGVRSFEHAYELDDQTAKALAAAGAFLTPTLCVSRLADWMAQHHFTEDQIERAMAVGPSHLDSIKRAVDAGVTLVNGTDYPPGEPADDTVVAVREMEFMAQAGLDPIDAIRSATLNAARLVHAEDEIGQVRAGYMADLIAVEADPTKAISAMRDVSFVMANGALVRDDRPMASAGARS